MKKILSLLFSVAFLLVFVSFVSQKTFATSAQCSAAGASCIYNGCSSSTTPTTPVSGVSCDSIYMQCCKPVTAGIQCQNALGGVCYNDVGTPGLNTTGVTGYLYTCNHTGAPTSSTYCTYGCQVNANKADACKPAPVTPAPPLFTQCGTVAGEYCTSSSSQTCPNGTSDHSTCSMPLQCCKVAAATPTPAPSCSSLNGTCSNNVCASGQQIGYGEPYCSSNSYSYCCKTTQCTSSQTACGTSCCNSNQTCTGLPSSAGAGGYYCKDNTTPTPAPSCSSAGGTCSNNVCDTTTQTQVGYGEPYCSSNSYSYCCKAKSCTSAGGTCSNNVCASGQQIGYGEPYCSSNSYSYCCKGTTPTPSPTPVACTPVPGACRQIDGNHCGTVGTRPVVCGTKTTWESCTITPQACQTPNVCNTSTGICVPPTPTATPTPTKAPTPTSNPTPTPTQCTNLFSNGGFEQGNGTTATGWTPDSNTTSDLFPRVSGGHSGSWAVKGMSPVDKSIALTQRVPLIGNSTYTLSGYIKPVLGSGHIYGYISGANGDVLTLNSSYQGTQNPNAQWEYIHQTFTTTGSGTNIEIDLYVSNSNEEAWFDDVSLTTGTNCGPTLTPTPTLGPTPTATLTPTPTAVPTPTLTPAPTLGPTPTPAPGDTVLKLIIGLDGIGTTGDNVNSDWTPHVQPATQFTQANTSGSNQTPLTPGRSLRVDIIDSNGSPVGQALSANINFVSDSTSPDFGKFVGTVDLGSSFATGDYTVKVTNDAHLRRLIGGTTGVGAIQKITAGQTEKLTGRLVAGDVDSNNVLNIQDYNILMSCIHDTTINNPDNGALCAQNANYAKWSDLYDNGVIDNRDYNLFLREYSVQNGD